MEKRYFSILLLAFLMVHAFAGKRVTISGIQYESISDNEASATLTVQAKGDIVILEWVEIGKQKFHVVQIDKQFGYKNKKVTSVTLPNSVKAIKTEAFRNCTNLKRIVLPVGGFTIENDAFVGCGNITEVEGNLTVFVEYTQKNNNLPTSNLLMKPKTPLFSSFAENKLKSRMEIWQTKKDYETIEQYKGRVTDENRRKRMNEFVEDLKKEYAALYAPNNISTSIKFYDNEYEVFTIQTMFYGNIFAQVPKADASNFQLKYSQVEVLPEFGVQADTLAIVGCKFKLEDKVYANAANYAGSSGNYNFELPPLDINLAIKEERTHSAPAKIDNAVDRNIPQNKQDNKYTFALIIGNERYEHEQQVPFANNDAKIFAEYCKKTLGLPNENVKILLNGGLNRMRHEVLALVNTLKAYDGAAKAIVYYAGHGMPDESSLMPYLLPTDGFATDIKSGYSLTEFYDELASAPSKMTLVFLDACFSGAKRDGKMLADSRGVAIKARNTIPEGNLLVFSASQGNETAYSDGKHGHGMFTYYLLKHLQETAGKTTLNDISEYVIKNVKQNSVKENNGKIQTPTIVPSLTLMNSWQTITLK